MAESVAVVDDEVRSPAPAAASIFFCHSCGVEIERVTEVIVCGQIVVGGLPKRGGAQLGVAVYLVGRVRVSFRLLLDHVNVCACAYLVASGLFFLESLVDSIELRCGNFSNISQLFVGTYARVVF